MISLSSELEMIGEVAKIHFDNWSVERKPTVVIQSHLRNSNMCDEIPLQTKGIVVLGLVGHNLGLNQEEIKRLVLNTYKVTMRLFKMRLDLDLTFDHVRDWSDNVIQNHVCLSLLIHHHFHILYLRI